MTRISLDNPEYYINREASWLAFNRRVLEEAQDERNQLLERVKFLAIVGSNLDEFFMVRVAGLKQQIAAGVVDLSPDGLTPAEQFADVRKAAARLMHDARDCWRTALLPQLKEHGITIVVVTHDEDVAAYARRHIRFRDGRIESDDGKAS